MGFIPINLNDAKEPKPVPQARYDLTILNAEPTVSRKGKPQFDITIGINGGDENTPPVKQYISIPMQEDEPDALRYKTLLLKRFLTLFKIKVTNDGFDPEALAAKMVGATANCELTIETEKDQEGNEKAEGRTFNRLNVPRLKDEQGMQAATGASKR